MGTICGKNHSQSSNTHIQFIPVTTGSSTVFKFEALLGSGSFGKVSLVSRPDSGKVYALKSTSKRKLLDSRKKAHALTERLILAQVKSEFIVKLHCAFQSSTHLHMVLDFMQGGDLFYHMRRAHSFSEATARFYAAEILLALEDLHALDVIYRDLKPENILVAADGHLKLADFNLAKIEAENPQTICGTPEYLAPEVLLGETQSKLIDFWCFGVLLAEMLQGTPPFHHHSAQVLFRRIVRGEFTLSIDISAAARRLIQWLLRVNPEDRPKNAEVVKQHEFFYGVDWNAVRARSSKPPITLSLKDEFDLTYFKTRRPSVSPRGAVGGENYDGFTFVGSLSSNYQHTRDDSAI